MHAYYFISTCLTALTDRDYLLWLAGNLKKSLIYMHNAFTYIFGVLTGCTLFDITSMYNVLGVSYGVVGNYFFKIKCKVE